MSSAKTVNCLDSAGCGRLFTHRKIAQGRVIALCRTSEETGSALDVALSGTVTPPERGVLALVWSEVRYLFLMFGLQWDRGFKVWATTQPKLLAAILDFSKILFLAKLQEVFE